MSFAENLKTLRLEKKVTQKELATFLSSTVKTVSHWETGYCEPSIAQLIALADYFEITVDDLVEHSWRGE
ncbi:MAG: helix-turn-helix transcriptional regulator [Clostridia bacterium]|nr:helix-turn-helix transcriptional regulator [Clostridia bacterium]